ncbi:MAG: DUF3426 domain-containing protein [Pseudomonadota bacterium]
MTMVTRCPECSTAFKVSTEQLQARDGAVRCGRCQRVFNAFDALTTWPDSALAPPDRGEGTDHAAEVGPMQPTDIETPPEAHFADGASPPAETEPPAPADALAPAHSAPDATPKPEAAAGAEEPPELDWVMQEPPRRRRATVRWSLAVLLAAVALAAQAAYFYRTELATALPATRPYLESACEALGCRVPLPARAEYIVIEASDLKADAERPNRLLLTVALRNRAPFAQQYPALELTLTGPQNQPLARRVFLPADYAAKDRPLAAGLAPNAVADVLLPLDTGDLAPSGYRLYSFYP